MILSLSPSSALRSSCTSATEPIRFEPATPELAATIRAQRVQRDGCYAADYTVGQWATQIARSHWCEIAARGNKCLCVAGLVVAWPGRGMVWLLLDESVGGNDLVVISKRVKRRLDDFFDAFCLNRLETTVRSDFAQGHRWATMLGFGCEGKLRKYGPSGEDHCQYARVR